MLRLIPPRVKSSLYTCLFMCIGARSRNNDSAEKLERAVRSKPELHDALKQILSILIR